jgi:hypothetical protein
MSVDEEMEVMEVMGEGSSGKRKTRSGGRGPFDFLPDPFTTTSSRDITTVRDG